MQTAKQEVVNMHVPKKETVDFMSCLDRNWRRETGLTSRDYYSIFYAPPEPHNILILGLNPAGTPGQQRLVDVERGFSEYIDGYGRTSTGVRNMLRSVLPDASEDDLRRVPGSNVIFRRGPDVSALPLPVMKAAAKETAPFLSQIIERVAPKVVLVGGEKARDMFFRYHVENPPLKPDEQKVCNSSGWIIYELFKCRVRYLCHEVSVIRIPHFSRRRKESDPHIREYLTNLLGHM